MIMSEGSSGKSEKKKNTDVYTSIPIRRSTKRKLEKGMSRSVTWDSLIQTTFSGNAAPVGADCNFTLSFNGEELTEDEIRSRLNAITSSPGHDCFDNDAVRDRVAHLEAKVKKLGVDLEKERNTKRVSVGGMSIDSLVLEFDVWGGSYGMKHPLCKKAMEDVKVWLEGHI